MAKFNCIWRETAEVLGVLGAIGSLIFVALGYGRTQTPFEAQQFKVYWTNLSLPISLSRDLFNPSRPSSGRTFRGG